jgi:hypothetical protein
MCFYSVHWISRCPHVDQILLKFPVPQTTFSGPPSMGMWCHVVSRRVPAIGGSCCLHLVEQYLVDRGYRFLRDTKDELTSHTASQPIRLQISYRTLMWDKPIVCCKHKYNVNNNNNSQNTTKFYCYCWYTNIATTTATCFGPFSGRRQAVLFAARFNPLYRKLT